MNKNITIAGFLLLFLLSPTFAEENTDIENKQNTQNVVQIQKEFPQQRFPQGNFYGNSKKYKGNTFNRRTNNYYPPQHKFNNRLSQKQPRDLYERFPNSPFMSRPQSRFDSKFSMQPEFKQAGAPQELRRNGNFQHYHNYNKINNTYLIKPQPKYNYKNNIVQRPYSGHNHIKKG